MAQATEYQVAKEGRFMRKFVVILMVGALAAVVLLPGAEAKGRSRSFYLRWDDDGAGGCGPFYLSTTDAPDSAGSCWYTFQPAQEVLVAAGQPLIREWISTDGVPFKLGSGKVHGEITMNARVAAGTTLEVEVRTNLGTIGTTPSNSLLLRRPPNRHSSSIFPFPERWSPRRSLGSL